MDPHPGFPDHVTKTLARLLGAGFPVHVVGGALRDILLGREARDFDLVVDGDFEAVWRALPGAIMIPAHTRVIVIPQRPNQSRIEISVLHSSAGGLEGNLRRRDFTLNAIAFNPQTSSFVDPLEGRGDLSARRLRAADPPHTFRDDALRILRGTRLSFELDLTLEPETRLAMEREAWRLHATPGERLRDELFRLLALTSPSRGVERLRALGALAPVMPELLREVGVAQNRHHPEDVFRHSLRVCDLIRPDPLLRLAGLLHDAAKPESKRFESAKQDFSFLRHDLIARSHVQRAAKRLRLSKREESRIERLVRHHLLFPQRLQSDFAIRRMLRRVGRDILPDLLELRRADLAARDPKEGLPSEWRDTEHRIRELARTTAVPARVRLAIGGGEIMRELGIPEGPGVGRWLRRAQRRVLEHPGENVRERLLAWLREAQQAD